MERSCDISNSCKSIQTESLEEIPANDNQDEPELESHTELLEEKTSKDNQDEPELEPKTKSPGVLELESKHTITIEYRKGDMFTASPRSVLVHACNARGLWGKGIALEFKNRFNGAYKTFREEVDEMRLTVNRGKCRAPGDPAYTRDMVGKVITYVGINWPNDFIVASLITKADVGRCFNMREEDAVVRNTSEAMKALLLQLSQYPKGFTEMGEIKEICMPKINSGLFGVPWAKTQEALEALPTQFLRRSWTIVIYDGFVDSSNKNV